MAPALIGFVMGIVAAISAVILGASVWTILLAYCGAGLSGLLLASLWMAIPRREGGSGIAPRPEMADPSVPDPETIFVGNKHSRPV